MDIDRQGLVVFRASRLEALLDPLQALLRALPPEHALAPQTVIAAHPGIKQWLSRALARRAGPRGIVANLEITLPSTWIDGLALDVLGETAVAVAPYKREALRWRLFELIGTSDDEALRSYLRGSDAQRRRFQLADRLAQLYTRYLVYRPDWLAAWTAGRFDLPERHFLAPLWQAVRAQIGVPHRGERLHLLLRHLQQLPPGRFPGEPLHMFGLSHLAPAELAVLRAMARHRPVALYVPDPCREYWAGLRPDRARLRELAELEAFSERSERQFLEELGHPLLAAWGRLGQHFMMALAENGEVIADIRHGLDDPLPADAIATAPLLVQVQESLRQLDPLRLRPYVDDDALHDRSLRVHACHTRLRELEVLRDALLREREERPELKPADIVVMAPDIRAYVPLLPAVFGVAGAQSGPLPYHLADVPLASTHPLLLAFARLLDLPASRLGVDEVLDLLGVPDIARALRLDTASVELLGGWLAQSRVAWALDGRYRADFGVPPIDEYSFAWGMDRLLAGYVFGQDGGDGEAAFRFDDGAAVVPVGGVQGPQAEALGALDRLLLGISALHRAARTPRSLSAWSARLRTLADELFRIDLHDAAAERALFQLHRLLDSLGKDAADAGADPVVEWPVVRDVLQERLAATSDSSPFVLGGITFCGMVPQRTIPFRVIAVLGLNDGEFPRAEVSGGLDLMATHRRLGDRDVRSDDRYLFLETLMAARDALHLSYLGEGVRDGKPRNPAAPLAELLALLDERAGLRDADAQERRPWLVRHPLQPFDRHYFDGSDARLFSYRADLLRLGAERGTASEPFLTREEDDSGFEGLIDAPLSEVLAYYRDPARQVLRQRLGIRLAALEETRLGEREPLEAQFDRLERVSRRLLLQALQTPDLRLPETPPDWLRHGGLWPPGAVGERAWHDELEALQTVLQRAAQTPLLADGLPPRSALAVDALLGIARVQGELGRVHRHDGTYWLFDTFPGKTEAELGFRDRIGLFLEWCLLHAYDQVGEAPVRILLLTAKGDTPWQDALNRWSAYLDEAREAGDDDLVQTLLDDLRYRAGDLLAVWARAQNHPVWYFPRTSWVAVQADSDADKVARAWDGSYGSAGERDYEPGYANLLAGDARFVEGEPEYKQLLATAQTLQDLINPDIADGLDDA